MSDLRELLASKQLSIKQASMIFSINQLKKVQTVRFLIKAFVHISFIV